MFFCWGALLNLLLTVKSAPIARVVRNIQYQFHDHDAIIPDAIIQ
jgi:hypothetical protein